MNQNNEFKAVISDFDGTISKIDFFQFVIDKILDESDIQPWLDCQSGKIRHIDALIQIFNKIHIDKEKFHELILELPIEECFVDTVKYCNQNKIDFYIISAGADYYIKVILEHLNISNEVKLISNPGFYSAEKGMQIIKPDKKDPFYSTEYGINKKLAVESIKSRYGFIVFAGDGTPDIEAAQIADKVFARNKLLELCKKFNVDSEEFSSYCEILEYLKNG